jgi:valyl-tRNA synthetase
MDRVQNVVSAIRALRKDVGVPEKEKVHAQIYADLGPAGQVARYIPKNMDIFQSLARVTTLEFVSEPFKNTHSRTESGFDVAIDFEARIDVPAERERLTKEIAKYEKGLISAERQLGNDVFLAKAPAKVVEGLKKQEAETRLLLEKARAALDALPKE